MSAQKENLNDWKKNEYSHDYWFLLSQEERAWVILKLFNHGVFTKEEVQPYLAKDYRLNLFHHALPVAFFPTLYYTLPFVSPYFKRIGNLSKRLTITALAGIPLTILWRNINPFRGELTAERERLLGVAFKRVGGTGILNNNELLPRYLTEFEINRRLRVLHGRREGAFEGLLFPGADRKKMEFDNDPFSPRRPFKTNL